MKGQVNKAAFKEKINRQRVRKHMKVKVFKGAFKEKI